MPKPIKRRFNNEMLDVSFLGVFSIVKLFEDDIPAMLKVEISKKLLGWKTEEAFTEWLEYIKGKQDKRPTNDKISVNIVYDISRIRNSIMMLWNKDIYKENLEWLEVIDLVGDSILMSSPIAEIVKIRNFDLSKIKDPKQKYDVMRAKQFYALPSKHTGRKGSTIDLFSSLVRRAKIKEV